MSSIRALGRRTLKVVAVLVAVGVVALVVLPTGRYLTRAAWEEARILARRRPIESIVADTTIPAPARARLRLVLDARRFAVEQLGLEAGKSFTTYSTVSRDTLVLVLTAAYRDRLRPLEWWFPIVGRVPYKGFFDFDHAKQAQADLERRGFDTILGASSAFSTLGWFNDPLLNTTLRADTLYLANTVIHELTHNTLFLKGQVEFNESFASFVGARGAEAFFRSRGSEEAARRVAQMFEDAKRFSAFWSMLARSVDSAFAAYPSDSAARVRASREVYAGVRRILLDSIAPLMPSVSRARLERIPLNNAVLLSRRTYEHDLGVFDQLLVRCGGALRTAIARVIEVTQAAGDPFLSIQAWVRSGRAC